MTQSINPSIHQTIKILFYSIKFFQECLTTKSINIQTWLNGIELNALEEMESVVLKQTKTGNLSALLKPLMKYDEMHGKLQEY